MIALLLLYVQSFCFSAAPVNYKTPFLEDIVITCIIKDDGAVSKKYVHTITSIDSIPNQEIPFQIEKNATLVSFSGSYSAGKRKSKIKQKDLNMNETSYRKNYGFHLPDKKIEQITFHYEVVQQEAIHLSKFTLYSDKKYEINIELPDSLTIDGLLNATVIEFDKRDTDSGTLYTFRKEGKKLTETAISINGRPQKGPGSSSLKTIIYPVQTSPHAHFNQWYWNLIQPQLMLTDASKKQIDEIVKNGSNPDEKALLFYQYVRDEMLYKDIATQLYKPANVNKTMEYKYGDCKDLSLLLYSGLRHLGFETHLGLSKFSGYMNISCHDFVSLSYFQHAVCVVKKGDESFILDPTEKNGLFDYPSVKLVDKNVFVIQKDAYKILEVPSPSAVENLQDISMTINIKKDKLYLSGTINKHGLSASSITTFPQIYFSPEIKIQETPTVAKYVFKERVHPWPAIEHIDNRSFLNISFLPIMQLMSVQIRDKNYQTRIAAEFKFDEKVRVQIQDEFSITKDGISINFKMEQPDPTTLKINYEVTSSNGNRTWEESMQRPRIKNYRITEGIKSPIVYEVLD